MMKCLKAFLQNQIMKTKASVNSWEHQNTTKNVIQEGFLKTIFSSKTLELLKFYNLVIWKKLLNNFFCHVISIQRLNKKQNCSMFQKIFSLMFSIKILLVQPNCNLKLGLSHYFCTLDMFDDEHENRFPFKIDE